MCAPRRKKHFAWFLGVLGRRNTPESSEFARPGPQQNQQKYNTNAATKSTQDKPLTENRGLVEPHETTSLQKANGEVPHGLKTTQYYVFLAKTPWDPREKQKTTSTPEDTIQYYQYSIGNTVVDKSVHFVEGKHAMRAERKKKRRAKRGAIFCVAQVVRFRTRKTQIVQRFVPYIFNTRGSNNKRTLPLPSGRSLSRR